MKPQQDNRSIMNATKCIRCSMEVQVFLIGWYMVANECGLPVKVTFVHLANMIHYSIYFPNLPPFRSFR